MLISGGTFALVDNISPDDAQLSALYNAFEKLRDPSHVRCLGLEDWRGLTHETGLSLVSAEVMDQDIVFDPWAARMRCTPATVARLREMLTEEPLRSFLRPRETTDGMTFTLREAIVIATKPA